MATTGSYKNIQVPSDKIRHVKAFGKIPLTWVKMNWLLMFTLEGAKLVSTSYNRPGASWISSSHPGYPRKMVHWQMCTLLSGTVMVQTIILIGPGDLVERLAYLVQVDLTPRVKPVFCIRRRWVSWRPRLPGMQHFLSVPRLYSNSNKHRGLTE